MTARFQPIRSFSKALGAFAAACGLSLASLASAQGGPGSGIDKLMQPDFAARDLPIISQGLNLDDTQKLIIKEFFEVYEDDVKQGLDEFKDSLIPHVTGPDATPPDQMTQVIFAAVEEWAKAREKLKRQLIQDIKEQVLNEEQLALWPSVERQLLRMKSLPNGRLSGETVDLVLEVHELDLHPALMEPLQPILDQYEIVLETALKNRDEAIEVSRGIAPAALSSSDHGAYLKAIDEVVKRRVAVRAVNEQYFEALAAALPAAEAATLRASVMEKSFPSVYRMLAVERMIKAAQEIPDLASDVLASVVALEQSFHAELATVNLALVQTIRASEPEHEMKKAEQHIARMAARAAGEAPKRDNRPHENIRNAFDQREALNAKYILLLQELLTPEQFATLPGNTKPAPDSGQDMIAKPGGGKPALNSGDRGAPRGVENSGRGKAPTRSSN